MIYKNKFSRLVDEFDDGFCLTMGSIGRDRDQDRTRDVDKMSRERDRDQDRTRDVDRGKDRDRTSDFC